MNCMAVVHKLHFTRSILFATYLLMIAHFHVELVFNLTLHVIMSSIIVLMRLLDLVWSRLVTTLRYLQSVCCYD